MRIQSPCHQHFFRSFSTVRNLPYLTWLFKLTSSSNFHLQSIYKAEQTSLSRAAVCNVLGYSRRTFCSIIYITLSDKQLLYNKQTSLFLHNVFFWMRCVHYLIPARICALFSWRTSMKPDQLWVLHWQGFLSFKHFCLYHYLEISYFCSFLSLKIQ